MSKQKTRNEYCVDTKNLSGGIPQLDRMIEKARGMRVHLVACPFGATFYATEAQWNQILAAGANDRTNKTFATYAYMRNTGWFHIGARASKYMDRVIVSEEDAREIARRNEVHGIGTIERSLAQMKDTRAAVTHRLERVDEDRATLVKVDA